MWQGHASLRRLRAKGHATCDIGRAVKIGSMTVDMLSESHLTNVAFLTSQSPSIGTQFPWKMALLLAATDLAVWASAAITDAQHRRPTQLCNMCCGHKLELHQNHTWSLISSCCMMGTCSNAVLQLRPGAACLLLVPPLPSEATALTQLGTLPKVSQAMMAAATKCNQDFVPIIRCMSRLRL